MTNEERITNLTGISIPQGVILPHVSTFEVTQTCKLLGFVANRHQVIKFHQPIVVQAGITVRFGYDHNSFQEIRYSNYHDKANETVLKINEDYFVETLCYPLGD